MNNETSIKYISSLLNNPGSLTDGDQGSIALFRQTFPYFLPARYMMALELHRKVAFAPEMLSGILPYMGDWMQFCDFLEAGLNEQVKYMPTAAPVPVAPVTSAEIITSRVVDKKKVTAHPEPVAPAVQEEAPVVAAVAETVPELPEVTDTIAPPVAEPVTEPVAVQHEEPAPPMAEAILPTDEPEEYAFVPPVAVHEMPASIPTAPKEDDYVVPPVAYEPPAKEQVAPVAEHEASFADIIAESIAADAHKAQESHVPPAPLKEEVIAPVAVAEQEVEIPAVLHSQPAPVAHVAPPVPDIAMEAEETVPEIIQPVYTFRQRPPVYAEPIISHASEAENTEDIIIPPVYETTHTSSPEIYIADIKETLAVAPAPEPVAEPPAEVAAPAQYETVFAPSDDPLIFPIYTGDYFLQQGEKIPEEIPQVDELKIEAIEDEDKSLMVVMSFSEWLLHFKNSSEKQKEETKDQKALRSMWQKEKLAAAIEEENEEIPENVFEMAVNSISKEDGLLSETLAEIYIKQGKYDKAVEMYRKLSLRNPQKSIYFARKIDEALKDKES